MARVLRLFAPVPALVSTIHNVYDGGWVRMAALPGQHGLVDPYDHRQPGALIAFRGDGIVPEEILRVFQRRRHRTVPQLPDGTGESIRRSWDWKGIVWLAAAIRGRQRLSPSCALRQGPRATATTVR